MSEAIGFAIVGLRRGYQAAKEVGATAGATLVAAESGKDVPCQVEGEALAFLVEG